ncbi:MAG: ABC transporter permease [Clostridiales bacterium]|nr:ABC transporter permease [Clostridiales bacterium]
MVKLFLLKMLRDIRRSAAAYGICMIVVAIGFCGYCVLSVASDHLILSRDILYQESAFADGFAEVYEAPQWVETKLEQLPGIEKAKARIVKEARLTGTEDEVSLKLISYQEDGLNIPMLFQGIHAGSGVMQVVPGNAFLQARGLKTGDRIGILISGRQTELEITGGGISPENIYMVKNIVEMLPDAASYDAGFVSYETMEKLYGMEQMANNFVFTLKSGYEFSDVKQQVEELLAPYGCYRVYSREEHLSASMLDTELAQLGKAAGAMPFLFLFVAAIILYITMHRMIEQQRIQIGTMAALGVSRTGIGFHYLGYGVFVGAAGGIMGGLLGNLSAEPLVNFYRIYFNLPDAAAPVSIKYLLYGTLLAGVFCGAVTFLCSKGIASLLPSDALRPPAPKSAKATLAERIPGFLKLFTVPGIMAVRSVARNKRRSLFTLLGIACAFMITATLVSMNTLFDVFLFDHLEKVQRQDYTIYFEEPVSSADAMAAIPDDQVEKIEPITEVSTTLSYGGSTLDGTIQSIPMDSTLCRLSDPQGNPVYVAEEGIVISSHMASLLGAGIGDFLEVTLFYPEEHTEKIIITGIIEQYLGTTAYMSDTGLGAVSEYRGACTGLLLKAAPQTGEALWNYLKDAPKVTGIESRAEKLQKWQEMMGLFGLVMGSMAFLGILTGLAVLYTSALISYEELKRELSVMLMLGMHPRQCLEVISTSQWILTFGGILAGIPMTIGASRGLSASMTTELYSLPDFVDLTSVVLSICLTCTAVFLSNRMILKKLKKISPVMLLMERE